MTLATAEVLGTGLQSNQAVAHVMNYMACTGLKA